MRPMPRETAYFLERQLRPGGPGYVSVLVEPRLNGRKSAARDADTYQVRTSQSPADLPLEPVLDKLRSLPGCREAGVHTGGPWPCLVADFDPDTATQLPPSPPRPGALW